MLQEDELDFEDFGDLGELGDIEGPELTTEELEAIEKELRGEGSSSATNANSSENNNNVDNTTLATAEQVNKEETSKQDETVLEEGETPSTKNEDTPAVEKSTTEAAKESKSPLQRNNKSNYNKFNNSGYGNNPYAHQNVYMPNAMAMNNMFPPYPQFSNRIYVNPKFNKGGANPQMQIQQQQQQQQRQFMEMEAQRMIMMQQQMQLAQQQQLKQQQDKQRMDDLDRKRREAIENMRKKRESKEQEAGSKRHRDDSHATQEDDRSAKRHESFRSPPVGGFSIKGAASRNASNLPPRNVPYQAPKDRQTSSPYSEDRKPSITSRLGRTHNSQSSNEPYKRPEAQPPRPAPARIASSSPLPIVTSGKSNTLIIKGLSSNTSEQDLRKMTSDIPGGAQNIKLDTQTQTATVVFPNVEAAVTFRRKYNRIQLGDSHINISFQK